MRTKRHEWMKNMFNFLKRNKTDEKAITPAPSKRLKRLKQSKVAEVEKNAEKKGFFCTSDPVIKQNAHRFASGITNLILGKKTLDSEVLDLIETQLISADVGVEATQQLIKASHKKLNAKN